MHYQKRELIATRQAYGQALADRGEKYPQVVVLDAEVKNSTFAELFQKKYPQRYFEMFIAEQNMVGVALGLSKCAKIPFVSSFAAFLTRAYDQMRMASYSEPNLKICGSHAGVSIGEDGPSQMGLEDLAMFRALAGSVVLYPSDAVSCAKLVELMIKTPGLMYLRTTRPATAVLYDNKESFSLGGSKTVVRSKKDQLTLVAAGITLHEALKASQELKKDKIAVRVIDAYSVKPIDAAGLKQAAKETNQVLVVIEDHRPEGGLAAAVLEALALEPIKVYQMAVTKIPGSGTGQELMAAANISAPAIVKMVKSIL